MSTVTVYSKPKCGGCKLVKRLLNENDIPFTSLDVYEDDSAMAFVKDNGFSSLPVTDIGGVLIDGFKPDDIEKALNDIGFKLN